MSSPESSTKRRPVPPPKTISQAELRESLVSPTREQRDGSSQDHGSARRPNVTTNTEAYKKEAMKHLRLPPGWDLRNESDVTYHTHVAKPVVHETIYDQVTESVEPKVTRDTHRYHQYDYVQPLEVEIPNDCYATNHKGDVVHAPGGLGTKAGQSSHWERKREDRGYNLPEYLKEQTNERETEQTNEQYRTEGPFVLDAEGGGQQILDNIRHGGIAQRFGGTWTSSTEAVAESNQTTTKTEEEPLSRPRGGLLHHHHHQDETAPSHLPPAARQGESFHSVQEDVSPPPPPPHRSNIPQTDGANILEQPFNRLSLDHQDQHQLPQVKPLPPLPETFVPSSPHSVKRVSRDKELRGRYSMDSKDPGSDDQSHHHFHDGHPAHNEGNSNPPIDPNSVPQRSSSVHKSRVY